MSAVGSDVGSVVGSVVGDATGIPGLGQIGSLIGSLFGGKPHYTPGGIEYKTAIATMRANQSEIIALENQVAQAQGTAQIAQPVWATGGSAASDAQVAQMIQTYIGASMAANKSGLTEALNNGDVDATLRAQQAKISELNLEIADLAVEPPPAPATTTPAATTAAATAAPSAIGSDLLWLIVGGVVVFILVREL